MKTRKILEKHKKFKNPPNLLQLFEKIRKVLEFSRKYLLQTIVFSSSVFSSGKELGLGRKEREKIRNGIYQTAAQYNGIVLTNGENAGLVREIGIGKNQMSHIYDDKVPIVGITDNQQILKLTPEVIDENHDAIICTKVWSICILKFILKLI